MDQKNLEQILENHIVKTTKYKEDISKLQKMVKGLIISSGISWAIIIRLLLF